MMDRLPRHRLARDRAGTVALTLLTIGIPARAWTVLTVPESATYGAFPVWAQCVVLSAYTAQLGAEAWGGTRSRMVAALVSAMAAGAAAALFLASDSSSGAMAAWVAQAGLQLWVFSTCSIHARVEAALCQTN